MKDAIFLTGAAARISQEVAFIDKLIEKLQLEISSDSTMLAGFSSGALNIAAINACFRSNTPLSWDDYYKTDILFNVKDSEVFIQNKNIPFDTSPLRITISDFLEKAKMNTLGDFTFHSYILAFSYRRLMTLWTYSKWNRHNKLLLSDLLMATSAIPILFPDQLINSTDETHRRFTHGKFADGGTGGSFKRFEYYLKKLVRQNGPLERIFIISPMREVTNEDYEHLNHLIPVKDILKLELKGFKLLKVFLEMISQNGFDTFIHRFFKWTQNQKIANEIYVCIPALEKNFPILNFSKQKEQYDAVCKWIDEHPDQLAIPLEMYVQKLDKKLKSTERGWRIFKSMR